MSWDEFCTLLCGIMPETPLGSIVTIRSEKDDEVIKRFNPSQKRIYNDWKNKQANKMLENKEELDKQFDNLSNFLASMFG